MSSIGLCNSPHSSKAADTVRRYQADSWRAHPIRERILEDVGGSDEHCVATDSELLSKAQAGDQQAFVEICNRHRHRIRGRINSIVRNNEDAEDIFQETLMRAYIHLDGFRGSCSFQTWITQIAINSALMLLRRRKRYSERYGEFVGKDGEILDFPEIPDPGPNPEQAYSKAQRDVIVSNEVGRLPAGFRTLVDLYYGDESSLADAAEALGITLAASKSRLTRARAMLRRRLSHHPLMCV